MIAALLVVLTSLLGGAVVAQAHQINLTNARLSLDSDRTVEVEVAMRGSDVDRVARTRVFDDASGLVEPGALATSAAPIVAYIETHTAVLGENSRPCRPSAGDVAPDGDGVVVRVPWSCAGSRIRCAIARRCSPMCRPTPARWC